MMIFKRLFTAGTAGAIVMALGFTTVSAAENPLKNYWNSNNGETGGYIQGSIMHGSTGDITAFYGADTFHATNINRTFGKGGAGSDQSWGISDVDGAAFTLGRDWGKLRFDWKTAAFKGNVETIGGTNVFSNRGANCTNIGGGNGASGNVDSDCTPENDAFFGYTSFNLYWDMYRFDLHRFTDNSTWAWNAAVTPYFGGGWGYGGGYMSGYKADEYAGARITNHKAGIGEVHRWEAGLLINLTSWLGVTAAYNYVDMEFGGGGVDSDTGTELHLGEVGVRLTF